MKLLHFTNDALKDFLEQEKRKLLNMTILPEELLLIQKKIVAIEKEIERRKNNGEIE